MHAVSLNRDSTVSIRARSVTKLFGETAALWEIDLDARSGELISVLGGNGSGKSTLLKILAGTLAPTRGTILTSGNPHPDRTIVGLVGHATHLFEDLTALENVELAAGLAHRRRDGALEQLELLGVATHADRRVGDLSAGTRRRVGLARVLVTDPDVILVDEPFAGLDNAAADRVVQALAVARDLGRLVVIATHDNQRSRSIATRSLILDRGRVRRISQVGRLAQVGEGLAAG